MVRIPTHRAPTHPGEMLLEEFLKPMGLSQRGLPDGIRAPYQRVNELINGRRGCHASDSTEAEQVLWEYTRLLDEPSASLGSVSRSAERGADAASD